jgi:gliding motility-associated-like protein
MQMKSIKLFYVIQTCFVYLLFGQLAKAQTTTSCFEIQSILVDACAPPPINGSSQEYRNEMLRFLVGPNPLNINNMYMDFGYGQTFQGIRTPDAITAAKTAELNATIQSCGQLIEPVNGVLPANAKVLWISSYLVSASSNSFSNLGETLYVIYHNSNSEINIAYFINYAPSATTPAPDNIVVNVSFGGASCSDNVSYFRPILVRQNGTIGAEDGATVNFTFAGNPTYTNGGCFAPYTPLSAAWVNPNTICSSAPPLNLLTTVTGTPGGTFTGNGVTNNVFDPSGQSGLVQITYTVTSGTCQRLLSQFIQVNASQSAAWTAPSAPLCQGATLALNTLITGGIGGTWSGSGVTGSTFNSTGLTGNIPITYSIGSGVCQNTSTQNVQVIASGNATWSPPTNLCSNGVPLNLNTTVTGTAGGTWSGTGIDAAGLFNPSLLTGNNSSITYTVGSGTCQAVSTQTIQVIASGSPAWTLPSPPCAGSAALNLATTITGTAGGTWTGTGVTTNGTFTPGAVAGIFPITYTVGSGACASVLTQNIQVISSGIATWTNPNSVCETSAPINLAALITGTTGGTWSGTGVNAAGLFNPSGLSGAISITYSVGSGACLATQVNIINVSPPPVAPSINGTLVYCTNSVFQPLVATGATGAAFNWYSNAALTSLLTTGSSFTPTLTNTSIWVTQTVTGCTSPSALVSLTFNPVPAVPQVQNTVSYCSGTNPQSLTASGTAGVFNWYTSAALTNPVSTGASYQPSGPGSFQLWVTEELNGCKSNPAIVTITEQPLAQAIISPNGPLAICAGEQVTLSSSSSSNNVWSTGATTQSIQVNSAATITLTVAGSCNQATDQVIVSQDLISASFSPSTLSGQAPLEVSFTSQTSNSASCDWLLDGVSVGDLTNAPATFDQAGVFRITLICTSTAGCESRDVKTIVVEGEDVRLYIPNAFSPNGDSINGVFRPKGVGIAELKGSIYDRWGQEVFTWKGLNNGWDGTINGNRAPNGIYAFRLDGIDSNKKKILEFGSVMLIH